MAGLDRWLLILPMLLVLVPLSLPGNCLAQSEPLMLDNFDSGSLQAWTPKRFKGETSYCLVPGEAGEGYCLKAECDASASGLVMERSYRLQDYPWLSWRWKIKETMSRGDARQRQTDDYAARIYVVFPHWFFPKTRTLNYIWANRLPLNELIESPVTSNSMMLAVESGNERAGEWRTERRNVLEDFRRAFGEEPPPVGAIAIMSDADDTGGRATAWYDNLCIGSQ